MSFLPFFSLVYTVLQSLVSAGSLFSCSMLFKVALRSARRSRLSEARFKIFFARQRLAAFGFALNLYEKMPNMGVW